MHPFLLAITLTIVVAAMGTEAAADCPMQRMKMVEDGRSQVTVVLPDTAGKHTKLAADDLCRCLSKALGTGVDIVGRLSEVKTPLSILLGEDFGVSFDVSIDDLQRDGYIIKTHGRSLLISGCDDNGVANGIYGFLMDMIGVKWFVPGDLFEVVPENPQMEWPDVDVKQNPSFTARVISGVTGSDAEKWLRRNRFDVDIANLPYSRVSHNFENILPPSIYGSDHPEYYAMIDGVRRVPTQDKDTGVQPCYTNPDIIELTARAADEFFKSNPTATTFPLGINDNMEFCRCPRCAELDAPSRTAKGGWPIYSDSYFHMINEVAKRVAQTNPGKSLSCYAYWGVELPPRHIKELPDNVVVALTQDTSQHFDLEYKKADRDLWLTWSRVAKHMIKYDYYGLGWLTPRHYPSLIADDLKFVAANRAVAFRCESYPNWPVNAPQMYMASRLLWDSSLDPNTLLEEYFDSLFGPAAPDMKHFNTLMERYWTQPRKGKWFQGLEDMNAEMAMADDALIEEAMQSLQRAKSRVGGAELRRIEYMEDLFKFTYAIVKGSCLQRDINKNPNEEENAERAARVLEMLKLAEDTYRLKWQTNPLYNTKYYGAHRFDSKYAAWRGALETAVESVGK